MRERHIFLPRPLYLLLIYFIFFSLCSLPGHAQHSYQLTLSRELPLLTAGAAGTTASILLRNKNEPLTAESLGELNASDIFAIDQSATLFYGQGARTASDIFLTTSYAFPLTTLFLPDIRSDPGTIGIMLAETILLNEALTGITKAVIKRPRPFTYNQDVPENIRTERASNFSFFSGHTSYTAALSFFTAKVISDNTDNNTVKAIAWSGAFLWPAATGYFRYKAGMHFPTDVIIGYLVGASIGYLVPQLHKTKKDEDGSTAQINGIQVAPNLFQVVIVF